MSQKQYPVEPPELAAAQEELVRARRKVDQIRRNMQPEQISDYMLKDVDGAELQLSSLFGDKDDLIVVHNMGKGCSYCTLWADGFNGLSEHLADRAGFVLVSFDEPSVAKAFSAGRGWKFRVLSNHGSSFAQDMGYVSPSGDPWPGISTFHRDSSGRIQRISHAPLGPGDDFCSLWHILDMLKDGPAGWEPKFQY